MKRYWPWIIEVWFVLTAIYINNRNEELQSVFIGLIVAWGLISLYLSSK